MIQALKGPHETCVIAGASNQQRKQGLFLQCMMHADTMPQGKRRTGAGLYVNAVRQGIGNFFKLVTKLEMIAVLKRDHLKRIVRCSIA